MPHRCPHSVVIGLITVALALALFSSTAQADEPRRIGIVVSVKVNVTDDEARALANSLGEVLRKERPVDIISGKETERRMPTEGLPDECVAKPKCRNDIGRRLDADELLMLVIVKMGNRVQIDATWANVASGKVTSRPQMVIEAGQNQAEIFKKNVPLLLPHIKKDSPKGPNIVIVPSGGTNTSSGRRFTRGTWIATGVAAAALIGGGVFALSAQQKFSSLDDDGCREVACDQSDIDSMRSRALVADVLFTVAAASTVTALVLYLRSGGAKTESKPKPPAVRVGVGKDSVGLSFGGSF